jgi:hypothetical protein
MEGYYVNNVNISDLFEPYTTGTKASDTGYMINGVDLSNMYKPYSSGTKTDTTNYIALNGYDLADIFEKKITALNTVTYLQLNTWSSLSKIVNTTGNAQAFQIDNDNNAYVGGNLTRIDNATTFQHIAKWNGGPSFIQIATSINGRINGLDIDLNNNLFLAGQFTLIGSSSISYSAKWNGIGWSGLGTGINNFGQVAKTDLDGNVYFGGIFTSAGGISSNLVAKWDTSNNQWEGLDTGVKSGTLVNSMDIDTSNNLYIGGTFTLVGSSSMTANYIAKWNKSLNRWEALPTLNAPTTQVLSIKFYDNKLYVATSNTIKYLYNGTWTNIVSSANAAIRSIEIDSNNGYIYVGGQFTTFAGVSGRNYLVRSTDSGTSWSTITTINNAIYFIKIKNDKMFLGGGFTNVNGITVGLTARLNNLSLLDSYDASIKDKINNDINTIAIDSTGNIFVGGIFTSSYSYIAKYYNSTWSSLGGTNNYINELYTNPIDGYIYVCGAYTTINSVGNNYISYWNGSSFNAMGTGVGGEARAINNDSSNNIYVGGNFTTAGGSSANYIAKWSNNSWSSLGSGVGGQVYAIAIDTSDNVYVGGNFTTAGGSSANYIAKWSNNSWSSLGSGLNGIVYTITIDSSNNVYVGGNFTTAGGSSANYIAKWSNNSWSALGSGVNGIVNTLCIDSNNILYAGGQFTTAGGSNIKYIAKWNNTWQSLTNLNTLIDYYVNTIVIKSNQMYIGGGFTNYLYQYQY